MSEYELVDGLDPKVKSKVIQLGLEHLYYTTILLKNVKSYKDILKSLQSTTVDTLNKYGWNLDNIVDNILSMCNDALYEFNQQQSQSKIKYIDNNLSDILMYTESFIEYVYNDKEMLECLNDIRKKYFK
jgi:hypothetical protein